MKRLEKRFDLGVTIGKFLPPHNGHHLLIETALAQCERLTVIVCWRADDFIPGPTRAAWLREAHPSANVIVIDDKPELDDDDSQLWANLTLGWLGEKPDAAFTSEEYGARWSHFMGCAHVCVDMAREQIPMRATWIRANPRAHLDWVSPQVRAHFVPRVVILGAESSGTTTLAQALAAHFQTVWVPEYGREYCEQNWSGLDYVWRSEEFAEIAREQQTRENEAARAANRVLICDTNAWATRLWHHRYMNEFSPAVEEIANAGRADLMILTDVDVPFVQDGIRDGEAIRAQMHQHFVEQLNAQAAPWLLVAGDHQTRLQRAINEIETRFFGDARH